MPDSDYHRPKIKHVFEYRLSVKQTKSRDVHWNRCRCRWFNDYLQSAWYIWRKNRIQCVLYAKKREEYGLAHWNAHLGFVLFQPKLLCFVALWAKCEMNETNFETFCSMLISYSIFVKNWFFASFFLQSIFFLHEPFWTGHFQLEKWKVNFKMFKYQWIN